MNGTLPEASLVGTLQKTRVVPVVVLDNRELGAQLARTLLDGGLPIAEVTLRSPNAVSVLEAMAAVDGVVVGAGTVVRAEDVHRCVSAGARFVVSPGFSPQVVAAARAAGVPILPGISTATELMAALGMGLATVKLFPAEAMGGMTTLEALAAPFPSVRFVPTGGIGLHEAYRYLAHPAVTAVGGSWMVPPDRLRAGDWDRIGELVAGVDALRRRVGR